MVGRVFLHIDRADLCFENHIFCRGPDLSEYAPNMRGSGVHGALLVLEPRFTAELLATLLSIPQVTPGRPIRARQSVSCRVP